MLFLLFFFFFFFQIWYLVKYKRYVSDLFFFGISLNIDVLITIFASHNVVRCVFDSTVISVAPLSQCMLRGSLFLSHSKSYRLKLRRMQLVPLYAFEQEEGDDELLRGDSEEDDEEGDTYTNHAQVRFAFSGGFFFCLFYSRKGSGPCRMKL